MTLDPLTPELAICMKFQQNLGKTPNSLLLETLYKSNGFQFPMDIRVIESSLYIFNSITFFASMNNNDAPMQPESPAREVAKHQKQKHCQ